MLKKDIVAKLISISRTIITCLSAGQSLLFYGQESLALLSVFEILTELQKWLQMMKDEAEARQS